MQSDNLTPMMLVADILAISPLAAPLFFEMRLNCPGCTMVRFCTLDDLCSHYEMDMNSLMKILKERLVQNASY